MTCPTESPVQEGRRYQAMAAAGMTVEEIAQSLLHVAVGHINRRLALVRLVEAREATEPANRA